jgi:gamma-glutamylcyclotransferase
MSKKRLAARTPSARYVTTATLTRHQLRFHKRSHDGSSKCDAYETGNHSDCIIGVVFEIQDNEKPILDVYEGLGKGYEKKIISVIDTSGRELQAYTYYATDIDAMLKPYHWYCHHVITGAQEHQLPREYIAIIVSADSVDDPNTERHSREMSIYENAAMLTR